MRKLLLATTIIALSVPSLALAAGRTPSTVEIISGDSSAEGLVIFGTVESSKKCEKNRTVEVSRDNGNNVKVLDTDTTSDRGAWAIEIRKSDGSGDYFVSVKKNDDCGGDKAPLIF